MQLCENGLATARMVGGLSPCLQGDMHACGSIHDLWEQLVQVGNGQRQTSNRTYYSLYENKRTQFSLYEESNNLNFD